MSEHKENVEYEFFESFEIDDGELEGISQEECFVLGAEFMQRLQEIKEGKQELRFPIHNNNTNRIGNTAKRFGYEIQTTKVDEDWTDFAARKRE